MKSSRFLLILAAVVSLSGYIFFIDRGVYDLLIEEDGIVETLTALALLALSFLVVVRLFGAKRKKLWVGLHLLMALVFFFGFGEEISWGQRIFSTQSGTFFSEYNTQGETNLHNLEVDGVRLNEIVFTFGLVLVFGAYFLLFKMFYIKSPKFQRLVDSLGIPIPNNVHTLVLILCTLLIVFIPNSKKWELWEAVFAFVLLATFLDPYNRKNVLRGAR